MQSFAAAQQSGTPTFGTTVVIPSGLRGDIYLIRKGTTVLPDFERKKQQPVGAVWTTTLNIPPRHWRSGFPGLTKRYEWFAIEYNGRFWIDKPGRYTFALLSDDGSKLYIDDQLVIDNDCQHPPDVMTAGVMLSGGVHRIRLPYFQGPRDCLALILAIAEPGQPWRIFSTDEFKPPSNPEQWNYGSVSDAIVDAPDADANPLTVSDFLEELEPQPTGLLRLSRFAQRFTGCVAEPIHFCGN